ncbi:MAG: hypothetical protein Kow0068_22290 [Marinilabiliales bacterium]
MADFKVSNEVVFKGEQIYFRNFSEDASKYLWDFGDNETSTEENPVHIYNQSGNYDVTLTIFSANNKEQSKTKKTIQVYTKTSELLEGTWEVTAVYNDLDNDVYNRISDVAKTYVEIDGEGHITTTGLPLFLYIGFGDIDYNKIKDTLSYFLTYNSGIYTDAYIDIPTNTITQLFDLDVDLKLKSIASWNYIFNDIGINQNKWPELTEPVLYSDFDHISLEISDENKDEMIWRFILTSESAYYYKNSTGDKILWETKNSTDMGLTHVYFQRIDSLVFQ